MSGITPVFALLILGCLVAAGVFGLRGQRRRALAAGAVAVVLVVGFLYVLADWNRTMLRVSGPPAATGASKIAK